MNSLQPDEIIRIEGLETRFDTEGGSVRSVDGVDLYLRRGETLAIVGESGSGKSVTCLSLMGLIQSPGRIAAGKILLRSRSGKVLDLAAARRRRNADDPRQRDRHDLPGADDEPEPALHGGRSDRRGR